LKQRIGLRCSLGALTLAETDAYIAARLRIAGGDGSPVFTPEAVVTIHNRSRGIPRTISVICDNALVTGFALDLRPIDRDVVLEVCRDFDFDEAQGDGWATPRQRDDEHASRRAGSFVADAAATAGDEGAAMPAVDDRGPARPNDERSRRFAR
jgi:general secretion pathway protein A